MDIHFDCTMCGKCCHNLKLPLSVDEAIRWSERGGQVQILTEALPWVEGSPPDDPLMRHKGERAFPVMSGSLPMRVSATLVAAFDGACPYLQDDMRCGAYDERPRVCRIYPAEVHPLIALAPNSKACPSDAWSADRPLLVRDGAVTDPSTASLIEASRQASIADVTTKASLCALLGLNRAALVNEGFVAFAPEPDALAAALKLSARQDHSFDKAAWTIVSNRLDTVQLIGTADAKGELISSVPSASFSYIAFFTTGDQAKPPETR